MAAEEASALVSVAIVELDVNGDVMVIWSYPGVTDEYEKVIQARSRLKDAAAPAAAFSRHRNEWHYWTTVASGLPSSQLEKTHAFSIHVATSTYNPERYGALASALSKTYLSSGEPTKVLEGYLSAFTTGRTRDGWAAAAHDSKMALVANTALAVLPTIFGQEVVLIWNAMLLKKRVVVFCERVEDLLQVVRALPQLVWHRQDWRILRPLIAGSAEELADLAEAGVYVAGVTAPEMRSRTDLYDVFVDVAGRSITVAEAAKADFQLGSFHRDVAGVLTAAAAAEGASAMSVIKAIAVKTKELVTQVKSLGSEGGVSVADIRSKGLPEAMQRFVYATAVAEGLAKTG